MQKAIAQLKKKHPKPMSYAKAVFDYLVKRFPGSHSMGYLKFDVLFTRNLNKLWNSKKLSCNQIALLYRIMLVHSKLFPEEHVRGRIMSIWTMLHQYAQFKYGDKWIYVDVWAHSSGVPFGKKP